MCKILLFMSSHLIIVPSLTNQQQKEGDANTGYFCSKRLVYASALKNWGGPHLCSITQEVARRGEPAGWPCVSPLQCHQHAACVLKTAQSSVCQRVIYDVSLVLLTGIFHSGSLSTFSSSYRRAPLSLSSSNNHFQTPCSLHWGPSIMPSSWGKAVLCSHGR